MDDQFSDMGKAFEESENWPLRRHLEAPSLLSALGDLSGLSVLDAGCGSGFYSRMLARHGAGRVVGLDASAGMLEVAEKREQGERLGITYVQGDLADAARFGTFDIVTAIYVLPYADSSARLADMCAGAAAALGAGGRFVAFTLNPGLSDDPDWYSPYGFTLESAGPETDGRPVTLTAIAQSVTLKAYRWSRAAYDAALRDSGFARITWITPKPTQTGVSEHGAEFWERYVRTPHALIIDARLP